MNQFKIQSCLRLACRVNSSEHRTNSLTMDPHSTAITILGMSVFGMTCCHSNSSEAFLPEISPFSPHRPTGAGRQVWQNIWITQNSLTQRVGRGVGCFCGTGTIMSNCLCAAPLEESKENGKLTCLLHGLHGVLWQVMCYTQHRLFGHQKKTFHCFLTMTW